MSTNPFPTITPNTSTSPIPSFGPRQVSLLKSTPLPLSIPTNPASTYISPPTTLNMPVPCYSDATLPVFLLMPMGMIDNNSKIVSYDMSLGLSIVNQAALDLAIMKQKMCIFTQLSMWWSPHSILCCFSLSSS